MISALNLAKSLVGLGAILRRDDAYPRAFDLSYAGFWQSFTAAWLTLPVSALAWLMVWLHMPADGHPPAWVYVLIHLEAYAVNWLYWPAMMLTFSKALERRERYYAYIIPYNWFEVVAAILMLPVVIIAGYGLVGNAAGLMAELTVFLIIAFYRWYIAVSALKIPAVNGVLLVIVDVILGTAVHYTARVLYEASIPGG